MEAEEPDSLVATELQLVETDPLVTTRDKLESLTEAWSSPLRPDSLASTEIQLVESDPLASTKDKPESVTEAWSSPLRYRDDFPRQMLCLPIPD